MISTGDATGQKDKQAEKNHKFQTHLLSEIINRLSIVGNEEFRKEQAGNFEK